MQVGDGVVVKRSGWTGTVMHVREGRVQVAFTRGGSGIFAEKDLIRYEVEVQEKSWPPPTLETK